MRTWEYTMTSFHSIGLKHSTTSRRSGFTLVELLVVIAIIGTLVGLLLPAVQSAREAGRQSQCKNHLKQLSLGVLGHENATRAFPSGGWGLAWSGDPSRGSGPRQPGGWIYATLPYIEENSIYLLGAGQSGSQLTAAGATRIQTAIPSLYCPTRRSATAYTWTQPWSMVNADKTATVGRSDYAANGGSVYTQTGIPYTAPWTDYLASSANSGPQTLADGGTAAALAHFQKVASLANGIVSCGSSVKISQVSDGVSKTVLLAEKHVEPAHYTTGGDGGDNEAALIGMGRDIVRWSTLSDGTAIPPKRDTTGLGEQGWNAFGSAHATTFNAAYCDGSVRGLSHAIDPVIFQGITARNDGRVVQADD